MNDVVCYVKVTRLILSNYHICPINCNIIPIKSPSIPITNETTPSRKQKAHTQPSNNRSTLQPIHPLTINHPRNDPHRILLLPPKQINPLNKTLPREEILPLPRLPLAQIHPLLLAKPPNPIPATHPLNPLTPQQNLPPRPSHPQPHLRLLPRPIQCEPLLLRPFPKQPKTRTRPLIPSPRSLHWFVCQQQTVRPRCFLLEKQ